MAEGSLSFKLKFIRQKTLNFELQELVKKTSLKNGSQDTLPTTFPELEGRGKSFSTTSFYYCATSEEAKTVDFYASSR